MLAQLGSELLATTGSGRVSAPGPPPPNQGFASAVPPGAPPQGQGFASAMPSTHSAVAFASPIVPPLQPTHSELPPGPVGVPNPFGGELGGVSMLSSPEGQDILREAFNVVDDVATARAGTEGTPTIITFMNSKSEASNRLMRPGFAVEFAQYGNYSGAELEEAGSGGLRLRSKLVSDMKPLLRLSFWDLKHLWRTSYSAVGSHAPNKPVLSTALREFEEHTAVGDHLLFDDGLGVTEGNWKENHAQTLAKVFLMRKFVKNCRTQYQGIGMFAMWERVIRSAPGRTPTVLTPSGQGAPRIVLTGSGATPLFLTSMTGEEDNFRAPSPGSSADLPPQGALPSAHSHAPTGVSDEKIYSLWAKGHTNPSLCKNCGAADAHSCPYCPQPRREDLPCAICFRGVAHRESDCPCPSDCRQGVWDLFIADFYRRISSYKGFPAASPARSLLTQYPQQAKPQQPGGVDAAPAPKGGAGN